MEVPFSGMAAGKGGRIWGGGEGGLGGKVMSSNGVLVLELAVCEV